MVLNHLEPFYSVPIDFSASKPFLLPASDEYYIISSVAHNGI